MTSDLPEARTLSATGKLELLVVRAAARPFALPLESVAEVVRSLPTAELPRVPPFVRGVAQYRSEAIPIVDLAGRLGLAADAPGPGLRLVILKGKIGRAGFLVSQVVGVWRVEPSELEGDSVLRDEERVAVLDPDVLVDWRRG